MNYRCYDDSGKLVETGQLPDNDPNVPTHGSISFEVAPDRWLSCITSEWVIVELQGRPFTWRDNYERISRRTGSSKDRSSSPGS